MSHVLEDEIFEDKVVADEIFENKIVADEIFESKAMSPAMLCNMAAQNYPFLFHCVGMRNTCVV